MMLLVGLLVLNTEDGKNENAVEVAKELRLAVIFDQQNGFPSHCGAQEGFLP